MYSLFVVWSLNLLLNFQTLLFFSCNLNLLIRVVHWANCRKYAHLVTFFGIK
jgi:hypothetical protein